MSQLFFDDFDEYTSTVLDVNVDMLINGLVRPNWGIRHVAFSGIHLQRGEQGSGDLTHGQSRDDGYVLYTPLRNAEVQHLNGGVLNSNSVVVFEPGCEFFMSSSVDHSWCSAFVPTAEFVRLGLLNHAPRGKSYAVTVSEEIVSRFRSLVLRLLAAAEQLEPLQDVEVPPGALTTLCEVSAEVINGGPPALAKSSGRHKASRSEIVFQAAALLKKHEGQPLYVNDLAQACGVSERTLRSVFNECFGVTPKRYMQLRRLHQIRGVLRSVNPDRTSVSEVLARHGEWEFGRFSQRYQAAFGELPSKTLRSR